MISLWELLVSCMLSWEYLLYLMYSSHYVLSGSALLVYPVTDAGATGVNVYLPGSDQVCPSTVSEFFETHFMYELDRKEGRKEGTCLFDINTKHNTEIYIGKIILLLLTFNSLHGLAAPYLAELLSRHQPTRSLRSADAHLLVVPCSNLSTQGDRAFSHAAPRLWNNLPLAMRVTDSQNIFKKQLKTLI